MKAVLAPFPAWGIDCDTVLTAASAQGLRNLGATFVVRYLGSITPSELAAILGTGLLVSLVTYADQWSGAQAAAHLKALAVPAGVTVWADVESLGATLTDAAVEEDINAWSDAVSGGGWQPGLYLGDNTLLTSAELYALKPVRYWEGASRVTDRNNALAAPTCGWAMRQSP